MREYQELDVVTTLVDVPADGEDAAVRAGDVGAIVHIATRPNLAYMVEFVDDDGVTLAMPFLLPEQIAPWVPPPQPDGA